MILSIHPSTYLPIYLPIHTGQPLEALEIGGSIMLSAFFGSSSCHWGSDQLPAAMVDVVWDFDGSLMVKITGGSRILSIVGIIDG